MTDAPVPRCSSGSDRALLPCPFCGGSDVGFGRTGQKWQTVACNECGAEGPCTEIDRDLIIQKWNTRTSPTPQIAGGVREALKPFAEIALCQDFDPAAADMIDMPDFAITPNDVRHARFALAALSPQAQAGERWIRCSECKAEWLESGAGEIHQHTCSRIPGVAQAEQQRGEPVMWVNLVAGPAPAGAEMRIRAWTADRKRMENLRAEGLDMQALYTASPPAALPADPSLQKAQRTLIGAPGNDQLSQLWNAIVANTKGDGFWIGEILLTTLEREVGFNPSAVLSTPRANPMVPWELDCKREVCTAPECECPAMPSTSRETPNG